MKTSLFVKKIIRRLSYYIDYFSHMQCKKSNGSEYPDMIFYVIGINYNTEGLFAIVKNVLVHIEYAIRKGYIPVVDMMNFKSQFSNSEELNAWSLFFLQPCGYDLNDLKNAKHIILSRNIKTWLGHSFFVNILDENHKCRHTELKAIYDKYIVPNDTLKAYMERKRCDIIGGKNNVLGVLCRGTDYTQKKPAGHPVQPSFEQLVDKIEEYIKKYGVEHIFVATEDASFLDNFLRKYGDMIMYVDQKRFENLPTNYISDIGIEQKELIKMNMDYYSSLYILSCCDYFIAGRTAGTIGVSFMTKGFKDCYYFDLGFYNL